MTKPAPPLIHNPREPIVADGTAQGVLGFISYFHLEGHAPFHSRHHRRGTRPQSLHKGSPWRQSFRWLFHPSRLNWWVSILFSVGSVCFGLASGAQLWPEIAPGLDLAAQNTLYFVGSIPFTLAAALMLWQSAQAPAPLHLHSSDKHSGTMRFPGYKPKDIGWLSAMSQFIGTLMFNLNTACGTFPQMSAKAQLLWIWTPNFAGSVMFLVSGTLAYLEVSHGWFSLKPRDLSWWIVVINLLGCIGFMISAMAAYPGFSSQSLAGTLAVATTFQGAACFLTGSVLMLPESASMDTMQLAHSGS